MADGGLFTLKRSVVPHGTTKVNVVYTNDPSVLERTLKMYEQKLLEDRPRFVGLDLEYTADQVSTAVVQLAMDDHVLVYHFCRSPDNLALREFLQHKGICFTTVDIRGDSSRFARDGIKIPEHNWIDIQDMINFNGPGNRTGMEMASPINFNQFLEKEKLKSNGSNFTDWFRHVRIFLSGGNLQYVLDAPLGDPPAETETDEVKAVYETRKIRYSQVQCAILCSLESDLQKCFEHHDPHELMKELKAIFETHAAVECYEASKQFFSCMMEEGSSVSEHMLAMTGHAKKLSDLGIVIPNRLGINRVLQSLPPSYKNFVMNYNMQNMNKELPELFGMLKAAEIEIKKEHQVLMVNKTTSFKKQGKSKGKFKKGGKKAATPPMKPKNGPKPDAECYYCKEKGHWKHNCSKYLADLKSGLVKKKKEGMEHWTAVKNILKYLKRTKDMFLCYGGDQELVVSGYTDASWNTDPDDSKSQSGYVFILNGAAVSWASSKQCTVAKSSTESEYIAASEASSEAVWMKRFIVELGVVPSALDPLIIYCDNMGAIANAQEPRSHKRLKHIKLRYHSIREYIEDGEVKICKVHTDLNVADPLTKALPRAKHDQHQNAMGVRYITM
ncbi:hypothetical protein QYE76_030304 [Lolium multiflorum]|uniref:CCHC-type domain-containing protein n=1 Tax=Lolium multiflorum TaxID=4521 RepID=A0AAD8QPH7_LOLMU|nr:hypothetical protein QYE76_030304 [Lolium multiflorum]